MNDTMTTMTNVTALDRLVAEAMERRQQREEAERRRLEEELRAEREEAIAELRTLLTPLLGEDLVAALDLAFVYDTETAWAEAQWRVDGAPFRLTQREGRYGTPYRWDIWAPDGTGIEVAKGDQSQLGETVLCAIGDWRARVGNRAQFSQAAVEAGANGPVDDCPF